MATNSLPFAFKRVPFPLFRRYVWILSGSKESFYVFEKRYESALLNMYAEGNEFDGDLCRH